MDALAPDARTEALAGLPAWELDGEVAITREFRFPDFARAMAFMTAAAMRADRMDHHPVWSNVYRQVTVRLTTHHVGALTELDVQLARYMDVIAAGLGAAGS